MLFRCETQFREFSKWSRSSPSSALTVTGWLKSQETILPLGVPTWVSSPRFNQRGSLFPEPHGQNVIASRRLREIRKLGQGQGQRPFLPPAPPRSHFEDWSVYSVINLTPSQSLVNKHKVEWLHINKRQNTNGRWIGKEDHKLKDQKTSSEYVFLLNWLFLWWFSSRITICKGVLIKSSKILGFCVKKSYLSPG